MNNHDKFIAAYSDMHAPSETLSEVMKMADNTERKRISSISRRTVLAVLAACLILALFTAGAAAVVQSFKGWGGNADYVQDENGTTVTLYTEQITEPVVFRDGKMIFIVNGEEMDITEFAGETNPFIYDYREEDTVHFILVGLNGNEPGNYGFAEYLKKGDEWLGGYSARTNTEADGKGPAWLENGKRIIGVPW